LQRFIQGELLQRLLCRHVFHEECVTTMAARSSRPWDCPNCRGAGDIVATYRHVEEWLEDSDEPWRGPWDQSPWNPQGSNPRRGITVHRVAGGAFADIVYGPLTAEEMIRLEASHEDHDSRADDHTFDSPPVPLNVTSYDIGTPFRTPEGYVEYYDEAAHGPEALAPVPLFEDAVRIEEVDPDEEPDPREEADPSFHAPWWPQEEDLTLTYHSQTALPGGRRGLLIDTGAWGNLAGEKWLREQAEEAKQNLLKSSERLLPTPLVIQGVGTGTQECQWEVTVPITLPRADGGHSMDKYSSPSVPGSALPALLGLKSLVGHRAVIDCITKKLYLAGPGGIAIDPSPGTEIFQLEQAPSGHLLLPVNSFGKATRQPATTKSSSSSSTAPAPLVLPVVEKEKEESAPAEACGPVAARHFSQ
jgi:hypothetical protein